MTDVILVDMFGNELDYGDVIVYPGRRSSSLWMNVAVVRSKLPNGALNITRVGRSWWGGVLKVTKTQVSALDRVVKLSPGSLSNIDESFPYIHDEEMRYAIIDVRIKIIAKRGK